MLRPSKQGNSRKRIGQHNEGFLSLGVRNPSWKGQPDLRQGILVPEPSTLGLDTI